MKTDSQLQRDVFDELCWEPMVEHAHIGVIAADGVVTLTGHVPNYAQKVAAERAAKRVKGVRAVAEEIEVKLDGTARTSDEDIARRILSTLRWDVTVPEEKIQVKVEHGYVTLTGEVDWNYQKEAARTAAARISGVRMVSNAIVVKSQPSRADIRDRIMAAFKRLSALDAATIDVRVEGGTVKLSGKVHGWNERRIAEQAVWAAPGVTRVEDDIVLA